MTVKCLGVAIMAVMYGSIPTLCQPKSIKPLPIVGRTGTSIQNLLAFQTGAASGSEIALEWQKIGVKHAQVIQLPPPWRCSKYEDDSYRPAGVRLQISGEPGLMIVANRQSGVYDVRSPIFYRFKKGAWRRITSTPSKSEFSSRGSCYVKDGRLYTWDYEMAPNLGHADPQRYLLREFRISSARIQLMSSRITRKEYSELGDSASHFTTPSYLIPRRSDPMREFGLRWKWWGDK